jgi:hypothetical protein
LHVDPAFLPPPLATLAANWPQYRGPQASGVDASKPVPIRWNVETGENILWQTPIPGLGHAAPIVWDDRVYVATAVSGAKADLKVGLYGDIESADDNGPQQWRLLALDRATGKIAWNILGKEAAPKVKRHTKASHCNSTPVTDGERIIAIFGSEGLFCFDLAGKLTWQKDLGPMDSGYFDVPSAQWGFASSPVIHEGKVIVQCDVQKDSFLAVFDVKDGREIWRTPRKDVPTWGSPTVVEVVEATRVTTEVEFGIEVKVWAPLENGDEVAIDWARPIQVLTVDEAVDGTKLCSPLDEAWFTLESLTPEVCAIEQQPNLSPFADHRLQQAALLHASGTCSLRLSAPEFEGGLGLHREFRAEVKQP